MNKLNKIIVCLIGKSGSGKTTIANKLEKEYGYKVVNSYTTRKQRYEGETGHTFIDLIIYESLPNKVATAEINGSMYCATKTQIDNSDIYVVDKTGLSQLKELYKGKKIVSIYIDVPMEICLERMRERGDNENTIWDRLRHDDSEFSGIKGEVDYVINGIPHDTWFQVLSLIQKEQ